MDLDGWEQAIVQAGRRAMADALQAVATAIGPDRHALVPRRYIATLAAASILGTLTDAAAEALDRTTSPTQIVIGDGAEWVTSRHASASRTPPACWIGRIWPAASSALSARPARAAGSETDDAAALGA